MKTFVTRTGGVQITAMHAGFLGTFPCCADGGVFTGFHLAAGNFPADRVRQKAILADQQDLSFAKGQDAGPRPEFDNIVILVERTEISRHVIDVHEGVLVHPLGLFQGRFHPTAIAD